MNTTNNLKNLNQTEKTVIDYLEKHNNKGEFDRYEHGVRWMNAISSLLIAGIVKEVGRSQGSFNKKSISCGQNYWTPVYYTSLMVSLTDNYKTKIA